MALMEVDQIVVTKDLWELAKEGDWDAKKAIRKEIDNMYIYFHALTIPDQSWWDAREVVTLRELEEVIPPVYVTIHTTDS